MQFLISELQALESRHQYGSAVGFIMVSCLLHTCAHSVFKLGQLPLFSTLVYRSSFSITLLNFIDPQTDLYNSSKFFNIFWSQFYLVLGGVLTFGSLNYIPIGEMTLIFQTNVLWSQILFRIYNNDPITFSRVRNSLQCLFGLYLILNPSFGSEHEWQHFLGCLYIFLASWTQSVGYIYMKRVGTSTSPVILVSYFHLLMCSVGSLGWIYTGQEISSGWFYILPIGMAMFSLVGHLLQFRATTAVAYNKLANYTYVQPTFATLMDYLLFGIVPSFRGLIGGLIIIVSMFIQLKEDNAQ